MSERIETIGDKPGARKAPAAKQDAKAQPEKPLEGDAAQAEADRVGALEARMDGMESGVSKILEILQSKEMPEVQARQFQHSYHPEDDMELERTPLREGGPGLSAVGSFDDFTDVSGAEINDAIMSKVQCRIHIGDGVEGRQDILLHHNGAKYLLRRGVSITPQFYLVLMMTDAWSAEIGEGSDLPKREHLRAARNRENVVINDITRIPKFFVTLEKATDLQHRLIKRSMNAVPRLHDVIHISPPGV